MMELFDDTDLARAGDLEAIVEVLALDVISKPRHTDFFKPAEANPDAQTSSDRRWVMRVAGRS